MHCVAVAVAAVVVAGVAGAGRGRVAGEGKLEWDAHCSMRPCSHLRGFPTPGSTDVMRPYDISVVNFLLSVTFACGLIIAALHVINRRFIAPIYDVILNLIAFASAVTTSILLQHWLPASLSALAVLAWIWLGERTLKARAAGDTTRGQRAQ